MTRRFPKAWIWLTGLLAGHAGGIHLMDRTRAMETLLSPGPHTPWGSILLALGFLMVRFALIGLGPGLLLWGLWQLRRKPPR